MSFILRKKTVFYLLLAVFFLVLDRFFKFLAINGLLGGPIKVIGSYFTLNFTTNPYIAFSLPLSGWALSLLIIVIILILGFYGLFLAKKGQLAETYALTFVIFGAISNLADRLKFGFVIDYFDLKYFTVFNFADAMIVGGIIFFIFYNFKKNE